MEQTTADTDIYGTLIEDLHLMQEVEGALSEKAKGWFNNLCEAVPTILDHAKQFFKDFEKRYKDIHDTVKMPSTYRSAKSVILGALEHGVPLIDDTTGLPYGKTFLEKETKTKKEVDKLTCAGLLSDLYSKAISLDNMVNEGTFDVELSDEKKLGVQQALQNIKGELVAHVLALTKTSGGGE